MTNARERVVDKRGHCQDMFITAASSYSAIYLKHKFRLSTFYSGALYNLCSITKAIWLVHESEILFTLYSIYSTLPLNINMYRRSSFLCIFLIMYMNIKSCNYSYKIFSFLLHINKYTRTEHIQLWLAI